MLLSYVKIALTTDPSTSGLADEEWFGSVMRGYFPPQLVERFGPWLDKHPLRSQIISTLVANDMVDSGGITFVHRAIEETGASAGGCARLHRCAEVFDLRSIWREISALMVRFQPRLSPRCTWKCAGCWIARLAGCLPCEVGTVDVGGEIQRFGATVERPAGERESVARGFGTKPLHREVRVLRVIGCAESWRRRWRQRSIASASSTSMTSLAATTKNRRPWPSCTLPSPSTTESTGC